jgi:hypothetical protein
MHWFSILDILGIVSPIGELHGKTLIRANSIFSLETYGAVVTQIKAPVGAAVRIDRLESALRETKYKIVTVTHVDTSTGVLSDIKAVANAVHSISPDTLVSILYKSYSLADVVIGHR